MLFHSSRLFFRSPLRELIPLDCNNGRNVDYISFLELLVLKRAEIKRRFQTAQRLNSSMQNVNPRLATY